jgi:hypothetical protein
MKFQSLLLGVITALCSAQIARATTRTVTSLNDDGGAGTLRGLISASVAGDTINFSVTGTITLNGELVISRSLTIIGPDAPGITLSGNGGSRIFNILTNSPDKVVLSNLNIVHGRNAGADGSENTGPGNGMGGAILNQASLTLTGCILSSNSATGGNGSYSDILDPQDGGNGYGGAVYNIGTLCLNACTFNNNIAGGGIGFANLHVGSGGNGYGGAIYSESSFTFFHGLRLQATFLTIANCTFNNNLASGGLSGDAYAGGLPGIGSGGGGGGAILNHGGLFMTNCTLTANSAAGASGVDLGNSGGSGLGGAIWNDQQINIINLLDCTFSGNTVSGGDGGDNEISGNGGSALGAGIFDSGKGIYLNNIIANNNATAGQGGYDFDNSQGSNGSVTGDLDGTISSLGHNLIGATDGSSGWMSSDLTGILGSPLNPLLGPLQNNGGPTYTMALLPTSAAIDAGDDSVSATITTDQRGFPRITGAHVDIGAYEFNQLAGASYAGLVTSTPNLLGYWRFDPVFQANSCVNGYTGTLEGNAQIGPPASGYPLPLNPANQALVLDGLNSYLQTSLTGQINAQGTVLAWVYLAAQPSTLGHVFDIAAQATFGDDFDFQILTDNHLYFYTDNGTSTVYPQALPLNQWHFLAATFIANGNRSIYLDGVPVAVSTAGGHSVSANPFTIGANYVFGGRYFAGKLSDVAVYNRALSAAEIAAIYSAASGVALNITPLAGQVVLTWLTTDTGYSLYQNSNLATANWTVVPGTPAIVGFYYTVTNPATSAKNFYRLRNP